LGKPLSAREVIGILEDNGFKKVRQRGSHIAMQRAVTVDQTITVIVPNHKQIRFGTLQCIVR